MAHKQTINKELSWGWTPERQFFISVQAMLKHNETGLPMGVPLEVWVLTDQELDKLRASISGIHIASSLPQNGNGGRPGDAAPR